MSLTILEGPTGTDVHAPAPVHWERVELDWLLASIEHAGKPAPGTWTSTDVVLCCTSSCSCGGGGKKVK